LTIASDARQFDNSIQPSNKSYLSNEPIPTNPFPFVGLTESISVPGCAQIVVPTVLISNPLNSAPHDASSHNLDKVMIPAQQNSSLDIQLSACSDPPPPYQLSEIPSTIRRVSFSKCYDDDPE